MHEDEIEAMAWELETAMMRIRQDPRAALAAGLASAEMQADWAKIRAKREAAMAKSGGMGRSGGRLDR